MDFATLSLGISIGILIGGFISDIAFSRAVRNFGKDKK